MLAIQGGLTTCIEGVSPFYKDRHCVLMPAVASPRGLLGSKRQFLLISSYFEQVTCLL